MNVGCAGKTVSSDGDKFTMSSSALGLLTGRQTDSLGNRHTHRKTYRDTQRDIT